MRSTQGMGHGRGFGDPLQLDAVGLADREQGEFSSTWHGNLFGVWKAPFYYTYLLYGTLAPQSGRSIRDTDAEGRIRRAECRRRGIRRPSGGIRTG